MNNAQPIMIQVMLIDKVSNTLIKVDYITLAKFAYYRHMGMIVTQGSVIKVYI
jgi:hypothetical protein